MVERKLRATANVTNSRSPRRSHTVGLGAAGFRGVTLAVTPPVSPMLAKLARELPEGDECCYEPKWDGFRCIVFRDGDEVELGSRNERPLTRYFPELLEPLRAALPEDCGASTARSW